jgi:hypothetical protein
MASFTFTLANKLLVIVFIAYIAADENIRLSGKISSQAASNKTL